MHHPNRDDYVNGRDPAMETILNYQPLVYEIRIRI